ncbi:MAG TPA: 2Fe-2S iron-sulfur cluster-binding protein [Paucimonas sp.]|nr:2Fe-2S iron-sulfur cluster-binding protein [Paucimonas sp.]
MDDRPLSVLIEPQQWHFPAGPETTVLQAALQAGIALPNSCRNGTCRTCMCRTRAGRVQYRIEWPGLSREEKDEGYILACVAYPQSDLVIVSPAARKITP